MRSVGLLFLCCLMLTACGSAKTANSATEREHDHKPSLDVKLDIAGNQVTVKVETGLKISEQHYGQARQAGEGHIHMYLDNGEKIAVVKEEQVFSDLAKGAHTLKLSLHNNDHTPYDVTKTIDFEIK